MWIVAVAQRELALMAIRQHSLAKNLDGINLMRSKGGPSESSLFDLKNGWITSQRTAKARPGSAYAVDFPANTVGMVAMGVFFHTFSHIIINSGVATNVIVNTLVHPTGGVAALMKIHEAFPFLGRLYVVAEFADGVVQHYWNENPASWTANTTYSFGAAVQNPIANGYYYEIKTLATTPAWQANTEVVVGESKQPRVANNFKYTATATTGTPTRTSNIEPVWPIVAGATVVERRYVTDDQLPTGSVTPKPPADGGTGPDEYKPFRKIYKEPLL